jgi:S1-C subfamily serine protease
VTDESPTTPTHAAEPAPAPKPHRLSHAAVSALVGGLVGALTATGVFLAVDDGGTTKTIVRAPAVAPAIVRPSTNSDASVNVSALIANAEPAVVAITTDGGPGSGTGGAGTGFVISPDGIVVTNNHVVEGAAKISVAFSSGLTKPAKLVGRDASADLAVVKVAGTNLPALPLGDSDAVKVGDEVVAIGNALALEGGLTVTRGIISGTDRNVDTQEGGTLVGMLQTDAAINFGNSGGPLLDAHGLVIGINTAIADPTQAQNIGFAIPISRAKPIIADLRAGRKPAFLGVSTKNVTPALVQELGLKVEKGAYVSQITPNTPADKVGIRVGDVIVSIGGMTINNSSDVLTAVRTHRPGDSVDVVLDRKGQRRTFQAKLAQRPNVG